MPSVTPVVTLPAIATPSLADRLDATRAAELPLGASRQCSQLHASQSRCTNAASSTVRGLPFCPGHAGFAAVSVLRASVTR